jgi:hypothetical protein
VTAQAPPASPEPEAPGRDQRAVAFSGLRRGFVQVFLPLALAGQGLAWFVFAVSGAYHPWSWFKIGFAYVLSASRVPFTVTGFGGAGAFGAAGAADADRLVVAFGAFTVLVIVLLFRAGREQGLQAEPRPIAAVLAGALVAPGFAIPCLVASLLVRLSFPAQGITSLRPVEWQAFVLPLILASAVGGLGGLAAARSADVERRPWGARIAAAGRGGWTAFAWGIVLAFVGFLLLATLEWSGTDRYARFMADRGRGGAVLVVHHALLLPNQSAMILAASMGAPTELWIGQEEVARLTVDGVHPVADIGLLLSAMIGQGGDVAFPWWYHFFWLVPVAASIVGGRRAAAGVTRRNEAIARGALVGPVYAVLCGVGAWGAAIVVPLRTGALGGSARLGSSPWLTAVLALPWGVVGGTAGAVLATRRWPAGRRSSGS